MEENDNSNEDNNFSDNSAISEKGEFNKLVSNNIEESGDTDKDKNNIKEFPDENIINNEQSRKSYNSMFSFSIVSKNGDNNLFNSDSDNSLSLNNSNPSDKEIRTSDIVNNISIWEAIKQQLSNFKNQIIFNFNIFTGLKNFNLNSQDLPEKIHIFDEKYSKQDEKLINLLKNIPWFSYRKDFYQIKEKDIIYTSDAGWGCMLRASQMILSQGLCKLFSIKDLPTFINEYFSYFYDNKIPVKLLSKSKIEVDNSKSESFTKKEEKKIDKKDDVYNDFLIVNDSSKESRNSFVEISMELIKGLEHMTDRNKNQNYITSPYSIRNYVKKQKEISPNGKKVGQWFSNYDVIKLITKINEEMFSNGDCDFKVINFDEGTVYIEDIIKECFEEEEEEDKENQNKDEDSKGFEVVSMSNIQKKDILFEEHINKNYKSKLFIANDKRYILKHKFLLFISVRHGLYNLEGEIYDDILKIFDINSNIGLIGGKSSRAFYFIGRCGKNLLFLDPHYVQPTIPLTLFGTDSLPESYRPNNIYYMPINELSPSFSIGFAIKDMKNFKMFMEKMKSSDYFIDQTIKKNVGPRRTYLFQVKDTHFTYKKNNDNVNQDISKNVKIKDNFY